MAANVIGDRVRYALMLRGSTQVDVLPRVNEALRDLREEPTALTAYTLSRIVGAKRQAKDFEVVALAQALDVDVRWLLGLEPLETLRDEAWGRA